MISREPAVIHRAFAALRTTCDPRGHDLLDELERWMILDNALLRIAGAGRIGDPPADLPDGDNFSRKVPDTPGLRLAGVFACDPDESCGLDPDYPINRGTPAHDLGGYAPGDPKLVSLDGGAA